jgi:2-C-methyl-D-erythritol 4-phosphate cytidylyltransferase
MLIAAVIVAAGRGHRLGGEVPKQYAPLGGRSALRRCVDLFLAMPRIGAVQLVVHPDDLALSAGALAGLADPRLLPPAMGGDTRAASVLQGLEALAPLAPGRVLIHDAARPFVPPAVVEAVIDALDLAPGAFAALPVVDALWASADQQATSPVPRDGLWRAQTPQGFHFDRILAAHRARTADAAAAADDVAVARAAGLDVRIVVGAEANYKITTAADLARARAEVALEEPGEPPRIELVATRS